MPSRPRVSPTAAEPAGDRALGKRDRRYREVIEAAAAVFAEKGFAEATTRDIGDRVGLLPGSLYYYIPSKEAALAEVCRMQGTAFNARLAAVLTGDAPVADKIRAGMRLHIQHNRSHLSTAFTFVRRDLPEAMLPGLKALARDYFRLWEAIFRDAVASGELAEGFDTRTATMALLALCNGSVEWYEGKPEREVERIAARLIDHFLYGALAR